MTNTGPLTLTLRTPCCDRAVTPATAYRVATNIVRRTCPSCRSAYTVKLVPMPHLLAAGSFAHEATWAAR